MRVSAQSLERTDSTAWWTTIKKVSWNSQGKHCVRLILRHWIEKANLQSIFLTRRGNGKLLRQSCQRVFHPVVNSSISYKVSVEKQKQMLTAQLAPVQNVKAGYPVHGTVSSNWTVFLKPALCRLRRLPVFSQILKWGLDRWLKFKKSQKIQKIRCHSEFFS